MYYGTVLCRITDYPKLKLMEDAKVSIQVSWLYYLY
jgi:hypothetical protein